MEPIRDPEYRAKVRAMYNKGFVWGLALCVPLALVGYLLSLVYG